MTAAGWPALARGLAEQLTDEGVLHSAAWRAALEQTPRHVFVPAFHTQRPDGTWATTAAGDDRWLEQVYSNEPLVTALAATTDGHRVVVSSSTKPGLMIRMLEALDIHDGYRVLEIGTGTGYNAALLCHRLGDRQVFSVDIGATLVADARERLATVGHTPVLAVTDGTAGLPDYGPYDRIIATCSVPEIPWSWAEQLRPGGLLLADLKRTVHAGNLVLLNRHDDRLEGRFLPRWAGFMAIRHTDAAPETHRPPIDPGTGTPATTLLDPLPWRAPVPWFLAHTGLPAGITFGYRGTTGTGPEWAVFTAPDGSWCTVRMQPGPDGQRDVRRHGPTRIWHHVETATETWNRIGRPGWERLGLTVHSGQPHRIWLDPPGSEIHWTLP